MPRHHFIRHPNADSSKEKHIEDREKQQSRRTHNAAASTQSGHTRYNRIRTSPNLLRTALCKRILMQHFNIMIYDAYN